MTGLRRQRASTSVLAIVAILFTACGGAAKAEPAYPPAPVPGVVLATAATAFDHLQRDEAGAYICVLRRSDDLADLRLQFTAVP